jgi:hypothetical protein
MAGVSALPTRSTSSAISYATSLHHNPPRELVHPVRRKPVRASHRQPVRRHHDRVRGRWHLLHEVRQQPVQVLNRSERHLALVFITHNLALVRSIAQSAVVLRQGAVAESGPVEQILEHPADPYTRRMVEDVPKLTVIS